MLFGYLITRTLVLRKGCNARTCARCYDMAQKRWTTSPMATARPASPPVCAPASI